MLSHSLNYVAVIGDLVGSRDAEDRSHLQDALHEALARVNERWETVDAFVETVGDEFQGVFDNLFMALDATMLIRASLPSAYDARFGIGVGPITWLGRSPTSGVQRQDGPAWWAARQAIEHVASPGTRRETPTLRTWVWVHRDAGARHYADVATPHDPNSPGWLAPINAYLVLRDHLVTSMDERERRILRAKLSLGNADNQELERERAERGEAISSLAPPYRRIAEDEGVSPSAISQRIRRSGVAEILYARDLLFAFFGPVEQYLPS